MVAGLEDITAGKLIIDGQVVNDKAPKDRDIAMVFQSYALYPHMTVGENMGFPLKLAGVDKGTIQQKVNEAAEMLELTQHLDRKPSNLSGGQRQRVAMGRAIVRQPKAFLMDEPLSNLDAKLRVQMRTQVSRIQKSLGTTTLYVTHDQTEAMTLGDRVVVMRGGVVQQVGSPAYLYDHPNNLFVAGFIGSPSMNFLPGQLKGGGTVRDRARRGPAAGPRAAGRWTRSNTSGNVILGIRPEHFEDASLVGRQAGRHVRRPDRHRRGDGVGRLRLLHREGRGGALRRPRRPGQGRRQRPAQPTASRSRPGWTPPRTSARGRTARLWYDTSKVQVFDADERREPGAGRQGRT